MQPTVIYFVRHGETDANLIDLIQGQSDVQLNANGKKQAETIGKRLRGMHFDCIYSSDLVRAKFTAQCIAGDRNIIYTPLLREWHLGAWVGKTLKEIEILYPDEFRSYKEISNDFAPANGESTRAFQQRTADFMRSIAANHTGETILCVSHGGFIRNVLQIALNIERFRVRPRVDNTAVSCIKSFDGGSSWQLVTWNDCAHLTTTAESSGY